MESIFSQNWKGKIFFILWVIKRYSEQARKFDKMPKIFDTLVATLKYLVFFPKKYGFLKLSELYLSLCKN